MFYPIVIVTWCNCMELFHQVLVLLYGKVDSKCLDMSLLKLIFFFFFWWKGDPISSTIICDICLIFVRGNYQIYELDISIFYISWGSIFIILSLKKVFNYVEIKFFTRHGFSYFFSYSFFLKKKKNLSQWVSLLMNKILKIFLTCKNVLNSLC